MIMIYTRYNFVIVYCYQNIYFCLNKINNLDLFLRVLAKIEEFFNFTFFIFYFTVICLYNFNRLKIIKKNVKIVL